MRAVFSVGDKTGATSPGTRATRGGEADQQRKGHYSALRYLTGADFALLFESCRELILADGAVILEEGAQSKDMYLVDYGEVDVRRAHSGTDVTVARFGPGNIINSIHFLDHRGSSATFVAVGEVRLLVLPDQDFQSLMASVPGFATRVYHSLAARLANRLRETVSTLSATMHTASPNLAAPRPLRTGLDGHDRIPDSVRGAVFSFRSRMVSIDQRARDAGDPTEQLQAEVNAALDAVAASLLQAVDSAPEIADAIGAFAFREIFSAVMTSATCDRWFSKPRGFPGDYESVELIYRGEPEGDARIGPLVDAWMLEFGPAVAAKERRAELRARIKAELDGWTMGDPMQVTSLTAGSARELFDLFEEDPAANLLANCLEFDREALHFLSTRTADSPFGDRIELYLDDVHKIASGGSSTRLANQRVIYMSGLNDTLTADGLSAVMDWMFETLQEDGVAIVCSFVDTSPARAFMQHILEWDIAHRTADELRVLFAASRFGARPVEIVTPASGTQIFAICRKMAAD